MDFCASLRLYTYSSGLAAILLAISSHSANALQVYDGASNGNNLEINLTTTLSYTGLLRVNDPSRILEGPTNPNGNDGDTNLKHGIVGNLFEAVPVLDIRDGNFGAHFSGQFYLNTPYLATNQNSQPATLNSLYVAKNKDFATGTRNANGENAQLLDAFIYGRHIFADGQSIQVKVGRQTLFWGQSLFFASNGISGGQAPINIVTAQDTIMPQAQQIFMPVGQVVVTYQPVQGLTLQAYYQFEWQHDYFQGAGAYFNSGDYLDKGGQSVIFGYTPGLGNDYLLRNKDVTPEAQNGQFGLSVQDEIGNYDVGVYALRFDAKAPEGIAYPGQGAGRLVPGGVTIGNYALVYPRDIWLQGASISTNVGAANVAGEVSVREHMPLITQGGFAFSTPFNPGNTNNDPLYPVGTVLYAQASSIYLSPAIPFDPGGVSLTGEVAMNHLLHVENNRDLLIQGHQATAAAFQFQIVPTYNEVLPNLDVTFPIGVSYSFLGRSQVDSTMYHGIGGFNAGVTGTYKFTWIASLAYQDYLGKPDPTYNGDADRGYVSLNLQHTF